MPPYVWVVRCSDRTAMEVGEPLLPPCELADPRPWAERLGAALETTDRRAVALLVGRSVR